MIKSVARATALARYPLAMARALAADAVAGVVAACGTSAGYCLGPYGSAPSSAPATYALAPTGEEVTGG